MRLEKDISNAKKLNKSMLSIALRKIKKLKKENFKA